MPTWLQTVCWFISGIFATGAFWYFLSQKNSVAALWSAFGAIVLALLAIALAVHHDIVSTSNAVREPTATPVADRTPSLRVAFNGAEMEYHNTGSEPFYLVGGVIDGRTDYTPTPVLVVASAYVQTHGAVLDLTERAGKILLTDGETRLPYDVYVRSNTGKYYVYQCSILVTRSGDAFQFRAQTNDAVKIDQPLPDFSVPGTLVRRPR